jgi:hypothetical protein
MAKILPLATRAFGAEPGVPDIASLASWVADHRGTAADLHAFRLDASLAPQLDSGVTFPCAGGLFCRDRILGSLAGLNTNRDSVTGELDVDPSALIGDSLMLAAQKKEVWCALPAPHMLGITNRYYGDDDEWNDAITGAYRTLMRAMRDAGIGGHVIICDRVEETEISILAGKKMFFFAPAPDQKDLVTLMEYQQQVAAGNHMLETLFDLANEYDIHRFIIMDPDKPGIRLALSHLDPDQVTAGGYCTDACSTYWEKLVESAVYMK